MINEIYTRRSIRKYNNKPISKNTIETIINAGIQSPSAKNRQPWKFIIVGGTEKEHMLQAMRKGIVCEECTGQMLHNSHKYLEGAKYTLRVMEMVPIIIFILNSDGHSLYDHLTTEEKIYERANIESVSAAIQNMILEAESMGLGSLWICDIFFAYDELNIWLNTGGEMLAALALGYSDENPSPRPRKSLHDVVEWRNT